VDVCWIRRGVWLAEHARPAEAGIVWDEAGGIFDALGATPWRERLDRAVAGARVPLEQPSA